MSRELSIKLYVRVLRLGIERRTQLTMLVEVTMAEDDCLRIELLQVYKQVQQGGLLGIRPRVLHGLAVAGTATNVAHADAADVAVIVGTMRSLPIHVTPYVDASVAIDDVVIANI